MEMIASRTVAATLHWARTIGVLMQENFAGRHRRSSLGSVFVFLEPIGIIAIISLGHWLTGGRSSFGTSPTLFYSTGILPFYVMFHISLRVRALDNIRLVPGTSQSDILIAHVTDELLSKIGVMLLVFGTLWLNDIPDAVPVDPLTCLFAVFASAGLGFGIGLVNGVIASFFIGWHFIYGLLMRASIGLSGILFVVDRIPIGLRDIAAWNPVTHVVTWFRAGFYFGYPTATLDLEFLWLSIFGVVMVGALLEMSTREWRN